MKVIYIIYIQRRPMKIPDFKDHMSYMDINITHLQKHLKMDLLKLNFSIDRTFCMAIIITAPIN